MTESWTYDDLLGANGTGRRDAAMALNRPRAAAAPDRPVQAAGAVLWRPGPRGPEIALIHRPRYDDWSLPKGKVDPGEHVMHTAVREVFEETAQLVVLGPRLLTICYGLAGGGAKRVRFWAGRALSRREGSAEFRPNKEVDQLRWLSAREAFGRLDAPLEALVLRSFLRAPMDTVPIVLLRHGTAEKRAAKYSDDLIRPLAAQGHAQAEALAGLLPHYGPLRVVSSPAVRCVDTARPFALKMKTIIDIEPTLSEPAHAAAPDAVRCWIRTLIAEGRPSVVCAHREVLDGMMAAVLEDVGPRPRSGEAPMLNGGEWSSPRADRLLGAKGTGARLRPGRAWILHVAPRAGADGGPKLVAIDRLKP